MADANVIAKLLSLGIEVKHSPRQQKVKCPSCNNQRNDKRDKSLSVNIELGVYRCHYCGMSGCVIENSTQTESYKPIEPTKNDKLSDELINFLDSRGISRETAREAKLSQEEKWIAKADDVVDCLTFNYYEKGRLVNKKYRSIKDKGFALEPNAKLVFYNIDSIIAEKEVVITEGEIDCLTFMECGIKNVISVPNGANRNQNNLKYLDNCIDYFNDIEKIYLAVDNDDAGLSLRDELIRRFGKDKCFIVKYPEGCKDANEVLLEYGGREVVRLIQEAEELPLEGIVYADSETENIMSLYRSGIERGIELKELGDEFCKLCTFQRSRLYTVTGIPSHGKALDINTKIPTPNGFKTMSELVIGDELFDENGNVCNVTWKSEEWKNRPTYKLMFSDGSSVIVDENHEWLTDTWKSRRSKSNKKRRVKSINKNGIDQSHKRELPSVKSTKDIIKTIKTKADKRNNHSVDLCKPLKIKEKQLPIDPYVLGCWLGDGNSRGGGFTSNDDQIIRNIISRGYEVRKLKTDFHYSIIGLVPRLREIGVLNNKHIPSEYLFSSEEQRFELLRGLMDTDGHCSIVEARNEFCGINRELVEGVYNIICSLGIKATFVEGDAVLNSRYISPKYRVFFKTDKKVFNLDRKQDVVNDYFETRGTRGNDLRYIVDYEEVFGYTTQCISVSSKSRLFLAGDQFIPTHNSGFTEDIEVILAAKEGWKFGIFSPEHYPLSYMVYKYAELIVGKPFFAGSATRMSVAELNNAIEFIKDHFFFIRPKDEMFTLDAILDIAKSLVKRYGIHGVVIDPWNTVNHEFEGESETKYIEKALNKITLFKQEHNVLFIIVAHPKKMMKESGGERGGQYEVPNLYEINGSSNFFNKTDVGFTVYRDYKEDCTYIYMQKVKYRNLGEVGQCKFKFNRLNNRYTPIDTFGQYKFDEKSYLSEGDQIEMPIGSTAIKSNRSFEDFDDEMDSLPF